MGKFLSLRLPQYAPLPPSSSHKYSTNFQTSQATSEQHHPYASTITTTLSDDVFREDPTTLSFEQDIASRCNLPSAAFVITGTMANQLGLRTLLTQPPHAILTASHSHIVENEAGGPAFLSGAMMQCVQPKNGLYLTLQDIQNHAILSDNVHKCPTRVISLENTISGIIVPLHEMQEISTWCRSNDIRLHLDGARLFEAVASGAGSLADYCSLFDTVALDFSKDLGAPMGAMLLGSNATITQARRIRKSIGGGMRQAGVLTAAAQVAVDENFGDGEWGSKSGKLRVVHERAKRVGRMWEARGGKLQKMVQTNQVWMDLDGVGATAEEWNVIGERRGLLLDGPRLVLHHQITEDATDRLDLAFADLFEAKD
jgi:threonine aldolase